MEQIVLDLNLKFVFEVLSIEQRGEVITALLNQSYDGGDETVKNVCRYIESLQQKRLQKAERMKELSAKGVCARLSKLTARLTDGQPEDNQRKETKENINNINKNINNTGEKFFESSSAETVGVFMAPTVAEVADFVTEEKLKVDAETFVNFYESHGWMVGRTPIRNWQATAKLWHMRVINELQLKEKIPKEKKNLGDETYWQELAERVSLTERINGVSTPLPTTVSVRQNVSLDHLKETDLDLKSQPFVRFMRRVEKFDLEAENEYDC